MQSLAEHLIEHGRVNIDRRAFFHYAPRNLSHQTVPFLKVVVFVENGYGVTGIRSPVEQADPLLGKEPAAQMILDDHRMPRHPDALPKQPFGIVIVMQHIGQNYGVEGVVRPWHPDAIEGCDGNEFVSAGGALGPFHLNLAWKGIHEGAAQMAESATHIQNSGARFQVRRDELDQHLLAAFVNGFVELPQNAAKHSVLIEVLYWKT